MEPQVTSCDGLSVGSLFFLQPTPQEPALSAFSKLQTVQHIESVLVSQVYKVYQWYAEAVEFHSG